MCVKAPRAEQTDKDRGVRIFTEPPVWRGRQVENKHIRKHGHLNTLRVMKAKNGVPEVGRGTSNLPRGK